MSIIYVYQREAYGGVVGFSTELQAGRSRVRFPMVSLKFLIDLILPDVIWPSNRNEYQEYLLGGGGGIKVAGSKG
jgi:hypothetical protein